MEDFGIPTESKRFIRILLSVALAWFSLGVISHLQSPEQIIVFTQNFLFSFLDVVFLLLLLVWNENAERNRKK